MDFKFEKSSGIGVLTFNGEIDGNRSYELKEAIMISIANADFVVVNLKDVSNLDISCLKIVNSAKKIAISLNKQVTFV